MNILEKANWHCKWKCTKYVGDINTCETPQDRLEWLKNTVPYEVIEGEGNLLLNVGADIIWDLVTGASANHFDNGNTTIGVGDDNTAANAAQTDLLGATDYQGMEGGFPTTTAQKITLKSSFGAGDANFDWEEWVIKRTVCLNRKVESLGTKAGGTWTLEVSITLS